MSNGFDFHYTTFNSVQDMQTKELNNGRLAMLAIITFWIKELAPPHAPSKHLIF